MPRTASLIWRKKMKYLLLATSLLVPVSVSAETEDALIGAGAATAALASTAAVAAPAVVAHSSGMAIMYSGAGYVAGTIGATAGFVAMLPAIAIGGAAVATGAVIYKYSDEIGEWYVEWSEDDTTE
jgi:hypothetical protein